MNESLFGYNYSGYKAFLINIGELFLIFSLSAPFMNAFTLYLINALYFLSPVIKSSLKFAGRVSSRVNVNGKTYYPTEIIFLSPCH